MFGFYLKYFIKRKSVLLTFTVVVGFVAACFVYSCLLRNGTYGSQTVSMIKSGVLAGENAIAYYFFMAFPFLVTVPFAGSYLHDVKSNEVVYVLSRSSERRNMYGKMGAIFVISFLLFAIPFTGELIVQGLIFPHSGGMGDSSYTESMTVFDREKGYLFYSLYEKNIYLYVMLKIVAFSAMSGCLAVFNYALSLLKAFSHKILTFIPIYVLFLAFTLVGRLVNKEYCWDYTKVLATFATNVQKEKVAAGIIALILLLVSFVIAECKIRRKSTVI